MGTYSTWEFYETFGGWPEPGETFPDDPDAARDAREDLEPEFAGPASPEELLFEQGWDEEGDRIADETEGT